MAAKYRAAIISGNNISIGSSISGSKQRMAAAEASTCSVAASKAASMASNGENVKTGGGGEAA